MWVKYRHKWSYGTDQDWEYLELGENEIVKEEQLNEQVREIIDLNWIDQETWRGLEVEIVSDKAELRKIYCEQLESAEQVIKHNEKLVKKYSELLIAQNKA